MQVLKLIQQHCPHDLPGRIGFWLGDGADGEVYSVEGLPSKVYKFGVLFDYTSHTPSEKYKGVDGVLSYLCANPSPAYATVHSHTRLGQWYQPQYSGVPEPYILYYYSMERLQKLSEDERKVFHSILSHEDHNIVKNYSVKKLQKMLQGMERGLDFDLEKVISFSDNIKKTPISHGDLHPRNIMKDYRGNFKLIDFDRATLEK